MWDSYIHFRPSYMMHMSITAELKNVSPDTVMKWKNLKSIIFVKMRLIKVTLSKQE